MWQPFKERLIGLDERILVAENITKYYGPVAVLRDINLELKRGEVHSLLGANGAGKSTLLNVLDGVITDHKGKLYIDGKEVRMSNPGEAIVHGIGMVHQELSVLPNISVAENIFLNRLPHTAMGTVQWAKLYKDAREVLMSIGIDIDPRKMTGELSVADMQMVEIARIVSMETPIILLDEPTSALSEAEIDRLLTLIRQFREAGKSVIFITHKLDEILAISDRVTVIRDGQVVDTVTLDKRDEAEERVLVSMMVGSEKISHEMYPAKDGTRGEKLLEVRNLTRAGVFEDISFDAYRGEVLVFTGLKGARRTEVMRCVFGADDYTGGEIFVKGKKLPHGIHRSIEQGMVMVTEDRKGEGIVAMMSVRDNISLSTIDDCSRFGWISHGKVEKKAKRFIEDLSIKVPSTDAEIRSLSGGNQQKAVLAKCLAAAPDILILDEPTRGIDVGAKMEIYRLIRKMANNGTAIIAVCSELQEAVGLADRLYVMRGGRMAGELAKDALDNEVIMQMMFGHDPTETEAEHGEN